MLVILGRRDSEGVRRHLLLMVPTSGSTRKYVATTPVNQGKNISAQKRIEVVGRAVGSRRTVPETHGVAWMLVTESSEREGSGHQSEGSGPEGVGEETRRTRALKKLSLIHI